MMDCRRRRVSSCFSMNARLGKSPHRFVAFTGKDNVHELAALLIKEPGSSANRLASYSTSHNAWKKVI